MEELKIFLNSILWNQELSVEEKYNQVIWKVPNYLHNTDEKKAVYEKIEWIFHDWLWTYFELLIYDKINEYYKLEQEESNLDESKRKMKLGIELYNKFFPNNEYNIDLNNEIRNIENASNLAINKIIEVVWIATIKKVNSSSQDFREWNARDLYIELLNWENLNFSIKTDKSGKVAVFEWQTPKIQEKVYNRYFNLSNQDFEILLSTTFPWKTFNEIKENYQNIALLTQKVIIKQLWLKNAEINNLWESTITNITNLKHLITQLKYYKRSDDNSILIWANRKTWELIEDAIIDKINTDNLSVDEVCISKTDSRKWGYWTEPTFYFIIDWKKIAFVSFQTKHQRWARSSIRFQDITIRLRTE